MQQPRDYLVFCDDMNMKAVDLLYMLNPDQSINSQKFLLYFLHKYGVNSKTVQDVIEREASVQLRPSFYLLFDDTVHTYGRYPEQEKQQEDSE